MSQSAMQITAEQISNQIVRMLQIDTPMKAYDIFKSPIETNNFIIRLSKDKTPVLVIKDKTLLNKFKCLTQAYEYPKTMRYEAYVTLPEREDDIYRIYKQWVIEEFGEEFYKNGSPLWSDKDKPFNRCCSLDGYFKIDEIGSVPHHIRTALYSGLIFTNEHPEKPIYVYDWSSKQFIKYDLI
jgi:hypothetical protein